MVVGPRHDGDRVGHRHLDLALRVLLREELLLDVIVVLVLWRAPYRGHPPVFVVEAPHLAYELEAADVGDGGLVHLRPRLLAAPDQVEAFVLGQPPPRRLAHPDRVEQRKVDYLLLLRLGEVGARGEQLQQSRSPGNVHPLPPALRYVQVAVVERHLPERLRPPRELGEATDLLRRETLGQTYLPFSSLLTSPSRLSFASAETRGMYRRSD